MKLSKCYFDILAYIVVNIKKATPTEKSVFDTELWMSIDRISDDMGYTKEQVEKVLKKLIKEGTIKITAKDDFGRYGFSLKNFYKKKE